MAGLAVAVVSTRRAPETYPVADTATTSLSTLRAVRGELAVGSYSRYGWNHPGPLLYQAFALPYAVSGRREIALKWTALALNLGWLAAAWILIRRDAPRLAVLLALALIPLLWRDQRLLFATWNPYAPVLALPVAVALAARMHAPGRWTLAGLVAVLSFAVQAHVGLAVAAAAIGLTALAAWWVGARRASPQPTRPRVVLLAALVTGAASWAVPLLHDLRHPPGNLAAILAFVLDPAHARPAWPHAIEAAAYMFHAPVLPAWEALWDALPARPMGWLSASLALQLGLVAVVARHHARQGRRFAAAFASACAATTLAIPIAAHGIVGPMSDYLLLWGTVVGALVAAVLLDALTTRLSPAADTGWTSAARVGLPVMLLVWAGVGGYRVVGKHADQASDTTLRALALDLQRYCDRHGIRRPLVDYDAAAWQELAGLVLQFDKVDRPIHVAPGAVYLVGAPFAPTGGEDATFYLMPTAAALPPALDGRTEWVTSRGVHRIVRVAPGR